MFAKGCKGKNFTFVKHKPRAKFSILSLFSPRPTNTKTISDISLISLADSITSSSPCGIPILPANITTNLSQMPYFLEKALSLSNGLIKSVSQKFGITWIFSGETFLSKRFSLIASEITEHAVVGKLGRCCRNRPDVVRFRIGDSRLLRQFSGGLPYIGAGRQLPDGRQALRA